MDHGWSPESRGPLSSFAHATSHLGNALARFRVHLSSWRVLEQRSAVGKIRRHIMRTKSADVRERRERPDRRIDCATSCQEIALFGVYVGGIHRSRAVASIVRDNGEERAVGTARLKQCDGIRGAGNISANAFRKIDARTSFFASSATNRCWLTGTICIHTRWQERAAERGSRMIFAKRASVAPAVTRKARVNASICLSAGIFAEKLPCKICRVYLFVCLFIY